MHDPCSNLNIIQLRWQEAQLSQWDALTAGQSISATGHIILPTLVMQVIRVARSATQLPSNADHTTVEWQDRRYVYNAFHFESCPTNSVCVSLHTAREIYTYLLTYFNRFN